MNNNSALYAFHILGINVYSFNTEKNFLVINAHALQNCKEERVSIPYGMKAQKVTEFRRAFLRDELKTWRCLLT